MPIFSTHFCPMFSCRNKACQIARGCTLPPILEKITSVPSLYDRHLTHNGSRSLGARSADSSVLIKITQQMGSGGNGDDPLQSARSSDDWKVMKSPSMSSRLGQLFSSLTSAAATSIMNLSPSLKLASPSKPPPFSTTLPTWCAISEDAASVGAKKLTKPTTSASDPLCLPCPNYSVIGLLNNV